MQLIRLPFLGLFFIAQLFLIACSKEVAFTIDPAEYRDSSFSTDFFHYQFKGSSENFQLTVSHQETEKIVWSSAPGQGFVAVARGEEDVSERRGMFTIDENTEQVCSDQLIDSIDMLVDGNRRGLRIRGSVRCQNDSLVSYTVDFMDHSANRIDFRARTFDENFNRIYLHYAADPDEAFMGFGEQFSFFDLRGKRLPVFVSEQGLGRGAQPITWGADLMAGAGGTWYTTYAAVPQYITSELRSLFLHNSEYAVFDMRRDDAVTIEIFSPEIRGSILHGQSPAELVELYTEYSGRMRKLPDWIMSGAVIGMQGGTETVREKWQLLANYDTPLAAFWLQDWVGKRQTSFGSQLWWNWDLDEDHYPGWDELVADLNTADIEMMTYLNPFLTEVDGEKENVGRDLYSEALENDYFVKRPDGSPYATLITDFSGTLIDFTNPEAAEWMKDVIRTQLIETGAKGWMADFAEALPYDAVLHSGEHARSYHNRYPVEWARVNREAIEEAGLGDEAVFFMRAGYSQSPEYNTLFWLGDQMVTFDEHDGLKTVVVALISSGLSGYSLNHSDIGGYTTITNILRNYYRSKELFLRWTELSAFNVVFRTHEGNQPENNHQFHSDEETLEHFSYFARIYANLLPYRRQLVEEAESRGLPPVRPLFFHYPEIEESTEIVDQFLYGEDLLVAPVMDPETAERAVFFPPGEWIHFFTGEEYGSTTAEWIDISAPIGCPPVFYRKSREGLFQNIIPDPYYCEN